MPWCVSYRGVWHSRREDPRGRLRVAEGAGWPPGRCASAVPARPGVRPGRSPRSL